MTQAANDTMGGALNGTRIIPTAIPFSAPFDAPRGRVVLGDGIATKTVNWIDRGIGLSMTGVAGPALDNVSLEALLGVCSPGGKEGSGVSGVPGVLGMLGVLGRNGLKMDDRGRGVGGLEMGSSVTARTSSHENGLRSVHLWSNDGWSSRTL